MIQYSDTPSHRHEWQLFREEVIKRRKRLFITIADECHWGPKAFQAHDKMVNDCVPENDAVGRSADARGSLLQQENYFVLLVSATPYNVLSRASRIPEEYMFVEDHDELQMNDILHQLQR